MAEEFERMYLLQDKEGDKHAFDMRLVSYIGTKQKSNLLLVGLVGKPDIQEFEVDSPRQIAGQMRKVLGRF